MVIYCIISTIHTALYSDIHKRRIGVNTLRQKQNFSRHFKCILLQEPKCMYFPNLPKLFSTESSGQNVTTSPCNGLALNRQVPIVIQFTDKFLCHVAPICLSYKLVECRPNSVSVPFIGFALYSGHPVCQLWCVPFLGRHPLQQNVTCSAIITHPDTSLLQIQGLYGRQNFCHPAYGG